MKNKKTDHVSKEVESKDKIDPNEFAYEVSSTTGDVESIEEIFDDEELHEDLIENEPKRSSTIKIISEKDMEIKEVIPPNFSPYLKCYLHYKGKEFIKRKRIKQRL